MKHFLLLCMYILIHHIVSAQTVNYSALINRADSLHHLKQYRAAANTYSEAFEGNGGKGTATDRYNAACSWSLANVPDSAFTNLYRIAILIKYKNYSQLSSDTDFKNLYDDKRWYPLLEKVKQNKLNAEINLNSSLVNQLDSIYILDQKFRRGQIKRTGADSVYSEWRMMQIQDSINLIPIKAILDKYGWLGADVVGEQGNRTLFLVIQHSNPKVQEHYLPMMRAAVLKGNANPGSLALLEDRNELNQGRKQIYGSQIYSDSTGKYIQPIEDVDNLDKRRAEVGLQPMSEYVKNWNLKWDIAQYKKDLPNSPAYKRLLALEAYIKSTQKQ